ncbi:hypothetical protein ABVT39_012749, partial [Epinephelus coioides]
VLWTRSVFSSKLANKGKGEEESGRYIQYAGELINGFVTGALVNGGSQVTAEVTWYFRYGAALKLWFVHLSERVTETGRTSRNSAAITPLRDTE